MLDLLQDAIWIAMLLDHHVDFIRRLQINFYLQSSSVQLRDFDAELEWLALLDTLD